VHLADLSCKINKTRLKGELDTSNLLFLEVKNFIQPMMRNKLIVLGMILLFIIGGIACQKIIPKAPANDEILDGPIEGLTPEQHQIFLRGDIAFNDAIFSSTNGLGPLFVATSCGSCHAGDGKGHPFTTLVRFGQTDATGNKFLLERHFQNLLRLLTLDLDYWKQFLMQHYLHLQMKMMQTVMESLVGLIGLLFQLTAF